MNKGRLTGADDLNNVLTSGIYEISAPTTGVLNGKDIQYGILIVFSAGQRIQLLGNGLYGNAYFRTGRDNGRWYDWVSIYWHKIYSKRELGGLLQVSSVGEIDLKPNINVSMKLREGIYAFYDNYAISGFILTVADNIYTNRSKIIAGEKSASLSIEFGSNGVTFQSNAARKLHYRLLAYYK